MRRGHTSVKKRRGNSGTGFGFVDGVQKRGSDLSPTKNQIRDGVYWNGRVLR